MKVKITTDFGEMSFDMSQADASRLIDQARNAAKNAKVEPAWTPAQEPERKRDFSEKGNATRPDGQEAYKGFLYIQCEKCGDVKGYCAKFPSTYYRCNCGHRTELRGLTPAHVICECGRTFNYKTNIREDFTINCLACGTPIEMEIGKKGTAFVPMGQRKGGPKK